MQFLFRHNLRIDYFFGSGKWINELKYATKIKNFGFKCVNVRVFRQALL